MNKPVIDPLRASLLSHSQSQNKSQAHLTQSTKKIPLTSERCIIFPFDKAKLRYFRDTYKKTLIKDVCTPEKITQVIADIESACDNFKEHLFYRNIIRGSLRLGSLGSIVGLALIIAGLVLAHREGSTSSQTTHSSGLHYYTVIGMIVISFSVILIYLVIIKVGHNTKDLNMKYIAKYDKVLASYRKVFLEKKMRWRIGVDRLWLELWLDYGKMPSGVEKLKESLDVQVINKGSLNNEESETFTENGNVSEEEQDTVAWENAMNKRSSTRQLAENRERKGSSKFEIAAKRSFLNMSIRPLVTKEE